jgi:hypothetical protein
VHQPPDTSKLPPLVLSGFESSTFRWHNQRRLNLIEATQHNTQARADYLRLRAPGIGAALAQAGSDFDKRRLRRAEDDVVPDAGLRRVWQWGNSARLVTEEGNQPPEFFASHAPKHRQVCPQKSAAVRPHLYWE